MENNTEIILDNEIKELVKRLTDVDMIEKVNVEMSNLVFEQRKESSRKSLTISIELKRAYLDGYRKALSDVDHENTGVKDKKKTLPEKTHDALNVKEKN